MTRAQEIVIDVTGMTCANCERHVAQALASVAGVIRAEASRAESLAIVTADPALATAEKLRAAVAEAGYEAGEVRFPE